jgi:prolyl oligopeptidase
MKMDFDRRQFLEVGATAFSMALLPRCLLATTAASATAGTVPPAPVARIDVAHDTYFGETLSDPYRWMENDKDPEWLPFLKGQNQHARAVLDALPARLKLLKRIQELSGETTATSRLQRAGGLTFFAQRPAGADNYKLFVRGGSGPDRVLVDPTLVSNAKGHVSLDWWRASPDGGHVVYGVSKDGSEDSILHVLKVADGKDLPEQIANTQDANPQWLDDGSGFFYNQLTGAVDSPERFLDSQARFHRLGTDPKSDPILMKRGLIAGIDYDRIQSPVIATSSGSKYALLLLADVRPEARSYIAPLNDAIAGKAKWQPIAGFEDEVTDLELDGDDLYLLVNKGTARGRIVKTSAAAPNLATAAIVVPQSAFVIERITRARDGLYLKIMDGGVSRMQRLRNSQISEIALPFDGSIGAIYAAADEDGVLISLQGWLHPAGIWSVDKAGLLADTGITPAPKVDVGAYEARRFFATAKDGVKIPYTLIYRKGLKLDGSAPAWISAYGSYGITPYQPTFAARSLALVDAGAIVGYANVRGGGEYGREWHKAGQLANKPNT